MRLALCIKDLDQFNQLADGTIATLDTQLVDRDICEVVENGWVQILPYVSFSHLDVESGNMNFIAYTRPSTGEGESRLQGKFSVGFGGHIDNVSEVYHTETVTNEDGETIYKLTLEDLKQTAICCAVRELEEEVGFNPFEVLQITDDHVNFGLERETDPDDVGKVHLCLSITVNLSLDRFTDFLVKAKANESEIQKLSGMSVDLGKFISSFNIPFALQTLNTQLDEMNAESWTKLVIVTTVGTVISYIQANFSLKDVVDGIVARKKAEADAIASVEEKGSFVPAELPAMVEDQTVVTDAVTV